MVHAGQLDQLRARDALGHEAGALDRYDALARSVEDEGRHADGGQDVPDGPVCPASAG